MSPKLRFWHTDIGFNYRLSNLLCALGVAQVKDLMLSLGSAKFLSERADPDEGRSQSS